MSRRWNLDGVDVPEFLRLLGIEVTSRSGVNAVFSCPFHGLDVHPSARMNVQNTAWLCSSCGAKGSATGFLARLRGMDEEEALQWIRLQFGVPGEVSGDVAPDELGRIVRLNLAEPEPPTPPIPPDEGWVEYFMDSWEADADGLRALAYLESRGFEREAIDRWGIGYDARSQRVAIPVRDVDGVLTGFKARSIAAEIEPRYLLLGDLPQYNIHRYRFNPYRKSEHVFGLCYIPSGSRVLVEEGELNVVATSQKTSHLAVGVAGSEFSRRQRELIVSRCSEVVVFFDDDAAGRRGAAKVAAGLLPFVSVSCVWGAPGDAADLSGEEIDRLVEQAVPATALHARGELSLTS